MHLLLDVFVVVVEMFLAHGAETVFLVWFGEELNQSTLTIW